MKQFTLTKEEFITRSMAGEVFLDKNLSRFYYDNSKEQPFRLNNVPLTTAWYIFNGQKLFTLEQPKPKIERRWKYRKDCKEGDTHETSIYVSDEYAKENRFLKDKWYKAEDCFIDVEIKG